MNNFIITSYYTAGSVYETHVMKLKASLEKFQIPYYLHPIESKGNWYKNTQYKPTFVLEMMSKFSDKDIVYTDADSEFLSFPILFLTLSNKAIAAHNLDHNKHRGGNRGFELLSGTLFIPNNEKIRKQIIQWQQMCLKNSREWDQVVLHQVIGNDFSLLPEEYCYIFDYKYNKKINPVVVHYQASRETRKQER